MMIYAQMRGEQAKPIRPAADLITAQIGLDMMCGEWTLTKKGRKARKDGCDRFLYYSDGKLAGMLWVNPILTPPQEPDKQPRRKGAKA